MSTKQFFAGVSAAVVLALAAPAHAGLVGGSAGGSLGGGLTGNLGGFGSRGMGGAGSFAAQGPMDQSVKPKPVAKAAKTADHKADNAARSTIQSGSDTSAAAEATATKDKDTSGANVAALANSAKSPATPAASTPSRSAPAAATPDKPAAHAQPSPAAGLSGNSNQTVNAAGHGVAGGGSVDAQHSKGSNAVAAAGSDSLN